MNCLHSEKKFFSFYCYYKWKCSYNISIIKNWAPSQIWQLSKEKLHIDFFVLSCQVRKPISGNAKVDTVYLKLKNNLEGGSLPRN